MFLKLDRLIAIAAIIATATAGEEQEASKAEAKWANWFKTQSKNMITGNSTIAGSSMNDMPIFQNDLEKVITYSDIISTPSMLCNQCVFAGGNWEVLNASPLDREVGARYPGGKCSFSAGTKHAQSETIVVDQELTYKQMFDGLASCNYGAIDANRMDLLTQNSQDLSNIEFQTSKSLYCESSWDLNNFNKKGTSSDSKKLNSWKYSWSITDDSFNPTSTATKGAWCFMRTYLPSKFQGGLVITSNITAETRVALKVKTSTVDRYFNSLSLKVINHRENYSIGIMGADHIDIYMEVAGATASKYFEIRFARCSISYINDLIPSDFIYYFLAIFTAVILGMVSFIQWLLHQKKDLEYHADNENENNEDDSYAKVEDEEGDAKVEDVDGDAKVGDDDGDAKVGIQ